MSVTHEARQGYLPAPACDKNNCGQAHHRLLHYEKSSTGNDNTTGLHESSEREPTTEAQQVTHIKENNRQVLLKVVTVQIHGPMGTVTTAALLDDGSTVTLMNSELAARVGLRGHRKTMRVRGAWDTNELECDSEIVNFTASNKDGQLFTLTAHNVSDLNLPAQDTSNLGISRYEHISQIKNQLNLEYYKPQLLIGQDNYHVLLPLQVLEGKPGEPFATLTPLGWCLHGCTRTQSVNCLLHSTLLLSSNHCGLDTEKEDLLREIHEEVRRSFAIDSLGVTAKPRGNSDDIRAQAHLEKTCKLIQGRWYVGLPYISTEALGPTAVRFDIEQHSERTLGLMCIPTNIVAGEKIPTKREMLRVMSIFDVFGFLSPFTIRGKIILQETWQSGIGWDESLTDELYIKWTEWLKSLKGISRISLPRHYLAATRASEMEDAPSALNSAGSGVYDKLALHVFRRLELQAAVLAARLADTIVTQHKIKPRNKYFWSDSTTVLHWIRNDARNYQTFVAHRLREIDELTCSSKWRYVPTGLNIADAATREECDMAILEGAWLYGPSFLCCNEADWPEDLLISNPTFQNVTEYVVTIGKITLCLKCTRSVKTSLKTILKARVPREEVLITLMAEVEQIVNSRPLTHVSVEPATTEAITPNHFLLGTSSNLPLLGAFDDSDLFLKKQWRISQLLADQFWRRWVKEVLPQMLPRKKWHHESQPLQIGDLVVIVDPNMPRGVWPRGIIEAVLPGRDGRVRVVDVRTKSGLLRRPAVRVAILPVGEEC
ncbi:uncharacterized protein LOC120635535 [Pararge aegeria]|nr:uncharacterized protein LOC120635535 [Pararge aegeria]